MNTTTVSSRWRVVLVGLLAGFVSQGVMGALFMNPWSQSLLSDPGLQSSLYRELSALRPLVPSIVGLVVWGIVPAVLHHRLATPGSWAKAGLVTGAWVWVLFWLPQEWFMYVTLIGEPLPLAALELVFAAVGCAVQGLILAWGLAPRKVKT